MDDTDTDTATFDLAALKPHPRLLLAAFLVGFVMLPVGLFLAALGVFVLKVSGGSAHDTSLVVAIAGFAVADFWGGGIVTALTRTRPPQVAAAWAIARLVYLVLIALVAHKMAPLVPVQLAFAVVAAFAGSRVSRKQASLRRHARAAEARGAGH